jgi:hypothetical protein
MIQHATSSLAKIKTLLINAFDVALKGYGVSKYQTKPSDTKGRIRPNQIKIKKPEIGHFCFEMWIRAPAESW